MNTIKIVKFVFAILSPFIVCFGAWCGGFDFDERGFEAFLVFTVTLLCIGGSLTFPEGEKQ